MKSIPLLLALLTTNPLSQIAPAVITQPQSEPSVIAHRGASGYLPEHTIASVTLAYGMGADYIEQDVVLSKDNIPVVLHDIHLETVTDVETVFPERHRQDGRYYAIDFSLAELKLLNVHERQTAKAEQVYPKRYLGQGRFRIPTLEEEILHIQALNKATGKDVGLYPEIKSPKWHRQQGYDISKTVMALLRDYQLDKVDANIFLQCFDFNELVRIRREINAKLPLVQLIGENEWGESDTDYDYLRTAAGITELSRVVQGVGPWYPQLYSFNEQGVPMKLDWVKIAQAHGLKIHPYTYRIDDLQDKVKAQQLLDVLFEKIGVDGVFTDFPDVVADFLLIRETVK